MSLDLENYEERAREAVRLFWGNREAALTRQIVSGDQDAGARGAVTPGDPLPPGRCRRHDLGNPSHKRYLAFTLLLKHVPMTRVENLVTTVSTKGQVILPKAIRQRRERGAGTRLIVEETPDGVFLKRAPVFAVTQPDLTRALTEMRRILKPKGHATLVFHSASADVWNALQAAYTDAGLNVKRAGVLDKTQGSFKQVTTSGAVRGDPVLLLGKTPASEKVVSEGAWAVAKQLSEASLALEPSEQTAHRLYSRFVSHFLTNHQKVPLDADDFYCWYEAQSAAKASDCAEV